MMSGALAGLSVYTDSDSDLELDVDAGAQLEAPAQKPSEAGKNRDAKPGSAHRDVAKPTRLKRKLPPLSGDSLQPKNTGAPMGSDVEQSSKKVARGDWLCYCYVEVPLDRALSALIRDCHGYLQERLGTAHPLTDLRESHTTQADENGESERGHASTISSEKCLHISLTRPFTVRGHERDEYIQIASRGVQRLISKLGSLTFSFSRISCLANDDSSKHFMVLEVGSGSEKLHKLSSSLSSELRRAFRAKPYYDEARFHASTACVSTEKCSEVEPEATSPSLAELGSGFNRLIGQVEQKWGPELRKHSPILAARVGIQVGSQVAFVDL